MYFYMSPIANFHIFHGMARAGFRRLNRENVY